MEAAMRIKRAILMAGLLGAILLPLSTVDRIARGEEQSQPDVIVKLSDLPIVPNPPIQGEVLRYLEGQQHGFKALSFAVAHLEPGSGSPRHRHALEEAYILLSGTVAFEVGSRAFTAEGPFIARIPAGVEHTVKNVGTGSITLLAVFPTAVVSEIDAR
jgi:quercetin dioxygenase-like cupin family protein